MARKKTLLEKAKAVHRVRKVCDVPTDEQIELALALVNGEVTFKQAGMAFNGDGRPGNASHMCSSVLRRAVLLGVIKPLEVEWL